MLNHHWTLFVDHIVATCWKITLTSVCGSYSSCTMNCISLCTWSACPSAQSVQSFCWDLYKLPRIRAKSPCEAKDSIRLHGCTGRSQFSLYIIFLLQVWHFFIFWFGIYSLVRLFHSFWAKLIVKWGENGRSLRKNTWPPASRTWLVPHVTRARLEPTALG